VNDDPSHSRRSRASVAVAMLAPEWRRTLPDAARIARRAARAALAGSPASAQPVEVSLALADDNRIRDLNRNHRGRNEPTNVLAFVGGPPTDPRQPWWLGDVVLARETILAEAAAQGKSVGQHMSHLVIHGVLHLLGFDHKTDRQARRMERLETDLLARLGVPDPYRSHRRPRSRKHR
jgi:probable rRNA maturation factor